MSIDNATPAEWKQAAYLANFAAANAAADLTPLDIEGLNLALSRAPFGELLCVTRAYVFLLHQMGKVRVLYAGEEVDPSWKPCAVYQVEKIEPPKTKPSIDWSQIRPEYKWLARDLNGRARVYTRAPEQVSAHWRFPNGDGYDVSFMTSYVSGDCDWKDSLIERPAGV